MDENLIMTIWDLFREYIPEKNREMAANQYVDFLANEFDPEVLAGFMGYDAQLDDAIKLVIQEEGLEEETYDEDDYGYDDEDY